MKNSDKDNVIVLDDFQKRFISILESQSAKYWMINLGIQSNLLWGWKKGNYPGLRYAIEVCKNVKMSANWLFLGIGPQYVDDLENVDDEVLMDENLKEELLQEIMSMKRKLKMEKEKYEKNINNVLSDIETPKILKTFSDIFNSKDDFKDIEQKLPSNLYKTLTLPALSFFKKNSE